MKASSEVSEGQEPEWKDLNKTFSFRNDIIPEKESSLAMFQSIHVCAGLLIWPVTGDMAAEVLF